MSYETFSFILLISFLYSISWIIYHVLLLYFSMLAGCLFQVSSLDFSIITSLSSFCQYSAIIIDIIIIIIGTSTCTPPYFFLLFLSYIHTSGWWGEQNRSRISLHGNACFLACGGEQLEKERKEKDGGFIGILYYIILHYLLIV